LYIRSELDESLPNVLEAEGKRYAIYVDSGYNARWFMEVPFQGANLFAARRAFKKSMSAVCVTVKWVFREIKMQFATVDFKCKMKIRESPRTNTCWFNILILNAACELSQLPVP